MSLNSYIMWKNENFFCASFFLYEHCSKVFLTFLAILFKNDDISPNVKCLWILVMFLTVSLSNLFVLIMVMFNVLIKKTCEWSDFDESVLNDRFFKKQTGNSLFFWWITLKLINWFCFIQKNVIIDRSRNFSWVEF